MNKLQQQISTFSPLTHAGTADAGPGPDQTGGEGRVGRTWLSRPGPPAAKRDRYDLLDVITIVAAAVIWLAAMYPAGWQWP